MREFLIASLIIIVSLGGALITGAGAYGALRRRQRRRGLMRAFLYAMHDGQLRATFRREKAIFGDGFIDSFVGSAGTLRFRLTRRFAPFRSVDPYRLELCGEGFDYLLKTSVRHDHPVVRAYLELRGIRPDGTTLSEAS